MKLYELLILIVLVVAAACAAYYVLSGSGESQLVDPAPIEKIQQTEDTTDDQQAILPPTSVPTTESEPSSDRWIQPAGSDGQWRSDTTPGQLPQNF